MSLVDEDYMHKLLNLIKGNNLMGVSKIYQYSITYGTFSTDNPFFICATFYSSTELNTVQDAGTYLEERGAMVTASGVLWNVNGESATAPAFYVVTDCYSQNNYFYFECFNRDFNSQSHTPYLWCIEWTDNGLALSKSDYVATVKKS